MRGLSIFITFLFLFSLFTPLVVAQTAAPTTAEQNEKLNERINDLKEKIASRVSELNLVEKRGVIGAISDTSATSITLTDINGETRLVDVDEITKFSSTPQRAGFGLSDLTNGTKIRVLGLYNKQSKRILARFVNTTSDPILLTGSVSGIDNANNRFTLVSEDNKQNQIDVETSTDISSYSREGGLSEIGFSGIATGGRVYAIGFPDKSDPSILIASRIIILTGVPKNPEITVSQPSLTANPTPVAN